MSEHDLFKTQMQSESHASTMGMTPVEVVVALEEIGIDPTRVILCGSSAVLMTPVVHLSREARRV